ncbi:MAG TPA: class I SAM-dependent methyltransferase [Acidimicrobiales bacterium]|nr:class I SAM-dependent methyltransferase [Acidimicrobiales bacterium]
MLTVDYDRLGARAGELLLDLGAGNGRHAYEAFRRGIRVVAADFNHGDMVECRTMCAAMAAVGEAPAGGLAAAAVADGQSLPFPDATFDRIIAAEVMEHIPDDDAAAAELARVLKPGGTVAVTVPAWLPEQVCWKLSSAYHAPEVVGGHVRIYTEGGLRRKLAAAGLEPAASHQVHALHTPYWWLRCAVGPQRPIEDNPLTKAYHRLLVWDMVEQPLVTRVAEKVLQPVLGKSLVLYARKPRTATTVESRRDPATLGGHARVA